MDTIAQQQEAGQGEAAIVTHIDLSQIDDAWESLCEAGRLMTTANDNNRWALGDLAQRVEKRYGESTLADFASQIRLFEKTLAGYRTVSMFYQKETREDFPALSWSHYREAMRLGSLEKALELLALVQDQNLSIREMTKLINEALGKPSKPVRIAEFAGRIISRENDMIYLETRERITDLDIGQWYVLHAYVEAQS